MTGCYRASQGVAVRCSALRGVTGRKYLRITPETSQKHPRNTPGTPQEHPRNTPETPQKHSRNITETPQKPPRNTSETPREYLWKYFRDIPETPQELPRNTPGTRQKHLRTPPLEDPRTPWSTLETPQKHPRYTSGTFLQWSENSSLPFPGGLRPPDPPRWRKKLHWRLKNVNQKNAHAAYLRCARGARITKTNRSPNAMDGLETNIPIPARTVSPTRLPFLYRYGQFRETNIPIPARAVSVTCLGLTCKRPFRLRGAPDCGTRPPRLYASEI